MVNNLTNSNLVVIHKKSKRKSERAREVRRSVTESDGEREREESTSKSEHSNYHMQCRRRNHQDMKIRQPGLSA